ncbi:MAG: alkaline phosphatase family protein [Bacteroidia bacterium]|nr:alkaline phosphatase family protein [Bacteroidia bacterium]
MSLIRIQLFFVVLLSLAAFQTSQAQRPQLVAGPAQMHTTDSTVSIWLMVKNASVVYASLESKVVRKSDERRIFDSEKVNGYTPVIFEFGGLIPEMLYQLRIWIDGKPVNQVFDIKTVKLEGEKPFTFLTGSCAFQAFGGMKMTYITGKIGSRNILSRMAKEPGDFMLWLGDNIYYYPGDEKRYELMMRRWIQNRKTRQMDELMRSRIHYNIWDDHDYGPDNCYSDWGHGDWAMEINGKFWHNPYYGTEEAPGNYCNFRYRDAEFFLLDNRRFRTPENSENPAMYGQAQMKWLQEKLKASTARFKFISGGSQMTSPILKGENYAGYPTEQAQMLDFLKKENITGIILLTGDKHFTELIKTERAGTYPIYELTCSPITSPTTPWGYKNNPDRVDGTFLAKYNWGRISIRGSEEERHCLIEIIDKDGNVVWDYTIKASELR